MTPKCNSPKFVFRLRFVLAGILFVAAAGLATSAALRFKLPWQAPTAPVGVYPFAAAVDTTTNTVYVANSGDNTISVIDGNQCNASNPANCVPIATMTNIGFGPSWPLLDETTHTLYVTDSLTETGEDGNTISVINIATCNAQDTSGCNDGAAATVTVGSQAGAVAAMALDHSTHTLYVGDATDGPLAMIDLDTCNSQQTSGCNQVVMSGATGAFPQVDPSNHSVYVVGQVTPSLHVFNGATCNVDTQSDCSVLSVAQLPANMLPWSFPAIDSSTHTLYLPVQPDPALGDRAGFAAIIDGSICNGTNHSGCAQTPPLVQIGSFSNSAFIDETTNTVYMVNSGSNSLSVIDAGTCNGQNLRGCPKRVPALATGLATIACAFNPSTHTIYLPSSDTNVVWVQDASQCNAEHPQGCTQFAPVTRVGGTAVGLKANPDTHTLYVVNNGEDTLSIVDTAQCNQTNPQGCRQKWPKIIAGGAPRFVGINRATSSVYVSLFNSNTIRVFNGDTCNSSTTSGCNASHLTRVGHWPQQLAVDESTNTIYVVNQADGTMSVIDGNHCNAGNASGCNQTWPVASVGAGPEGLTIDSNSRSIYVTNTDDNTVSVIDMTHCNAGDNSGCTPVATFPAGAGPRAAGVVSETNMLFVANRDDLSVSVIDISACNGSNTSGCPQAAPPAVVVGQFPETGGFDENLLGRSVTIDSQTHHVFLPVPGDADTVWLDGNTCTANDLDGCKPRVIRKRMGGFPLCAEVDQSTGTVYVTNNADATVSVFPSTQQ
jgi:DNA-binding beta-propeller fold protein YncE